MLNLQPTKAPASFG